MSLLPLYTSLFQPILSSWPKKQQQQIAVFTLLHLVPLFLLNVFSSFFASNIIFKLYISLLLVPGHLVIFFLLISVLIVVIANSNYYFP